MLSLCSRLAIRQMANMTISSSVRTIYSATFLGIDSFKRYAEKIKLENANNADNIKKIIQDELSKPDFKCLTEDLKTYMYLTKTDEEINTLVEAIKKYKKQSSLALFSFSFETPLMRLLYALNKTDKAIELFMNDDLFSDQFKPAQILFNKLSEENRYDELMTVANKYLESLKNSEKANKPLFNPFDIVLEALLKKNDSSALEQSIEFLKKLEDQKVNVNPKSLMQIAYFAIQQNKPDIANQVLNKINNGPIKINLKILSLIGMNRIEEAINEADKLGNLQSNETNNRLIKRVFFTSTLEKLVAASDAQLNPRAQAIMDNAKLKNLFYTDEIYEYLTKTVEIKRMNNKDDRRQNFSNQNGRSNNQYDQRPPRANYSNNQNRQFRTQYNNNQGQRNPQGQYQGQQQQSTSNQTRARNVDVPL